MVSKTEDNLITVNDAELYDRQIRIWGLEAQKRLRQADILIIGMNGLTTEVIKNIALTGVQTIVICDTESLTEKDKETNYFAAESPLGTNRAEASVSSVKELNPNVKVMSINRKVSQLPDDFFKKFTLILATGCELKDLRRLDEICKKNNSKFFSADMFGTSVGYFFMNLNKHKFVEEIKTQKNKQNDGDKQPETIVQHVSKTTNFPSLDATIEKVKSKLLTDSKDKDVIRMMPLIATVMTFQVFRNKFNRDPTSPEDKDQLVKISEKILDNLKQDVKLCSSHILDRDYSTTAPDCAIVGGILAQEIIGTISANVKPHDSLFLYDQDDFTGAFFHI